MFSYKLNGERVFLRTSTPKKASPYDFDPGPSTSSAGNAIEPVDDQVAARSSTKGPRKGSILAMICDAIESVGVDTKGASYMAIQKWIINNKRNIQPKILRPLIRTAISRGLETGVLKRSFGSKSAVGVRGYFTVNKKSKKIYQIRNKPYQLRVGRDETESDSNSSVERKRSILRIAEKLHVNAENVKRHKTKSETTTRESSVASARSKNTKDPEIDRKLETFMNSMLKIKEDFENAVHTVVQQASGIQETASKLIEVSNSLSMRNDSRQTSNSGNQTQYMASTSTPQTGGTKSSEQMHFFQDGVIKSTPLQAREMRANMANWPQTGTREDVMHVLQTLEGHIAQLRFSLSKEDEGSSTQSSQNAEAREVPTYLPSTRLARVAPMNSAQSGAARSTIDSVQNVEARSSPMNTGPNAEARSSNLIDLPQNGETRSSNPMDLPQSGDFRSTNPMVLLRSVEARLSPMNSAQIRDAMGSDESRGVESTPMDLVQSGESTSTSMSLSQDEETQAITMNSAKIGDVRPTSMIDSLEGLVKTNSMVYPQVRLVRLGLSQLSQGGNKPLQRSQETVLSRNLMNLTRDEGVTSSTQGREELAMPLTQGHQTSVELMHSTQSREVFTNAYDLCENRGLRVELENSLQRDLQGSPIQSSQSKEARVLPIQLVNNKDNLGQTRNSQSQEESVNEEIINSSQRSNAFSDSSFGISSQVSNLLQHMEDEDLS